MGTGFKAPTLDEIYKGTTIALQNLIDRPRNEETLTTEIEIKTVGNQDLKEETSLAYNLGTVIEPINGLSIGADYWYIEIEDIVATMDPQDVLDAVARGESIDGVVITRIGGETGRLEQISLPTQNLGTSEDAGYDANIDYRFNLAGIRYRVGGDYSRKLYARSVPFPGAEQRDTLGERGEPRWRAAARASVTIGSHTFSARNNHIAGQLAANKIDNIGSYKTVDLQYSWAHPWNGNVAVGALNAFDEGFPRDPSERASDDTRVLELYNPNGRVVYMNLNQAF